MLIRPRVAQCAADVVHTSGMVVVKLTGRPEEAVAVKSCGVDLLLGAAYRPHHCGLLHPGGRGVVGVAGPVGVDDRSPPPRCS